MSKLEQTNARYTLQQLLERGDTIRVIAMTTGILKSDLRAFYRVESDSDLTPCEIGRLDQMLWMAV